MLERCTAVCDGGVQRRTRVVVQRQKLRLGAASMAMRDLSLKTKVLLTEGGVV